MVQNKQQLVADLEKYFSALNVEELYQSPNHKVTKDWLAEVAAILKNLDEKDYQTFIDLRKHLYQDVHIATRRHAAEQIDAFVRQKLAEYKRYNFEESEKKLQEQVIQFKKRTEELTKQLLTAEQKIKSETKQIESAKGERAAVRFGKHFEDQAREYQGETKKWLGLRNIFFWILFLIIVLNVIGYFVLFILHKINQNNIKPEDFFTIQYGVAKLALLSILSYAIAFSSRNFNVNSNLSSLNRHRKNVAETLNDFLETNPEQQDRSKIVESATEAMFKHQPIGYLPKIESKDDGPIPSVINNFLKQN